MFIMVCLVSGYSNKLTKTIVNIITYTSHPIISYHNDITCTNRICYGHDFKFTNVTGFNSLMHFRTP